MNQRNNMHVGMFLLIVFMTLPGCGSKKTDNKVIPVVQDPAAIGQEESLESKPIGIMEGRTTDPMLPVYFGFDVYSIRGDQMPRMKVNADFLKEKKNVSIRIEGNCDPRGTREYNLALGEKRAQTAKKYLINLGVNGDRISTVSLGEEKILLHGHDELSWAQNRRDDFVVE